MQVFEQLEGLRQQVKQWKANGHSVGFVPTMGNLHKGHLSLVKIAQQHCDKVVVSIFVNPMQFGPNEDFDRYPRTFEADQKALQTMQTDALYFPSVEQMYPSGLQQSKVVVPQQITGLLEGASRPGHFDGVSTVVSKLFNMVQPDVAVFGQKDFQQLAVIKQMVSDLAMPIEIIGAPITRDQDGLALSSRNQYLNAKQRAIAPKLHTALLDIAQAIVSGNHDYESLSATASSQLIANGFDRVDYIQVCDANSLLPAINTTEELVILAVARLGGTRLLDNLLISDFLVD